MSEAIPRIFDLFLTSKFTGRGLGLAAVVGPSTPDLRDSQAPALAAERRVRCCW